MTQTAGSGTVFTGMKGTARLGTVFTRMTRTAETRTRMMGTGMIRHQAFGQFQGKLFNVLAQAVAQGAELLFFFLREARGFLFCIFITHFFHIGDKSTAARGQGDTLDTAVTLIHRTAEEPVVFCTGENLTKGGRAKIQSFAQFPGGDARIRRGALQQAADGGRERRGFSFRRAAPHGAGEFQICQDYI
jgi:hypothetical protein